MSGASVIQLLGIFMITPTFEDRYIRLGLEARILLYILLLPGGPLVHPLGGALISVEIQEEVSWTSKNRLRGVEVSLD